MGPFEYQRIRRHPVAIVGIVSGGHLLSHFYLLILPPLFPVLVERLPYSGAQLGALVSVIYLGMFLFQTPVGFLVDRVGGKWVLVAGLFLSQLGVLVIALSNAYLAMVAGALLSGVGQSAFHPADNALISVVTDAENSGKAFGAHLFAGYVGFAVAPLIVTGLQIRYDWRVALAAPALIGVAYTVLAAVAVYPAYRERIDRRLRDVPSLSIRETVAALFTLETVLLFGVYMLLTVAASGIQTYTPLLLVDVHSVSKVFGNTALTVFFALTSVGVIAGGSLADRRSDHRTLIAASVVAGGLTLVTLTDLMTSRIAVAVIFAALGLFYGVSLPCRDNLTNAISSGSSRGQNFGFVYTGLPLGGFVAPLILGWMIDFDLGLFAFAVVGAFFILTSAIVVALQRVTASIR